MRNANKKQIEAPTLKAGELCDIIEQSALYKSGRRFNAEELLRSVSCFKYLGTSRVKQLLARMADDSKLNKIREAANGNEVVYYVKKDSSRTILTKRWARPVTEEYTPRWY